MNDEFDPELLDPELELWEGIDTLKRQHREIVTSNCTQEEYMMEGLKEYMENEFRLWELRSTE